MELVQNADNKRYIHAVCDNTADAIKFYYQYRKHFGYMEVIDNNGHVLATLGSPA